MRALLQRVQYASVHVDGQVVGEIGVGLLILLGVGQQDTTQTGMMLAEKTATMRVFPDQQGRFDRSLIDVGGEALVVSQFTLYGDTRKGRRPSFSAAAPPEQAAPLVQSYCDALSQKAIRVATGVFGAHMVVTLANDGPVTIWLDSDTFLVPRN